MDTLEEFVNKIKEYKEILIYGYRDTGKCVMDYIINIETDKKTSNYCGRVKYFTCSHSPEIDHEQRGFPIKQIYDLNSSLEFFQNEFEKLDSRTMAILKSEISRLTLTFISDFDVQNAFCPNKEALTFTGFSELIKTRKNLSFKHKYRRL